jgi:hypothetical protein
VIVYILMKTLHPAGTNLLIADKYPISLHRTKADAMAERVRRDQAAAAEPFSGYTISHSIAILDLPL